MRRVHLIAIAAVTSAFVLVDLFAVGASPARSRQPQTLVAQQSGDQARISMLALRLAGRPDVAVEFGEALRNRRPSDSDELGIDLALGAAYEEIGLKHDAFEAWQRALTSAIPVYSKFAAAQTARLHLELGRPGSATRLARRALEDNPTWSGSVVSTLIEAVEANHDCEALIPVSRWRLEDTDQRRLQLASSSCRLADNPDEAIPQLVALLRVDTEDLVASEAAALLWPHRHQLDTTAIASLADALHHHRSFDRSTELLARLVDERETADRRYKLARGHFWLEDYERAAVEFQRAGSLARTANDVARAWYQRGRSLELVGNHAAALISFHRAWDAAPSGSWASASVLSVLRLELLAGRDEEAARLYRVLAARRGAGKMANRAALFLAASDISHGRSDRARSWLSRSGSPEFSYWKGRLAELQSQPDVAIDHYLALAEDPDHPLARWAHTRLRGSLAAGADARGRQITESDDLRKLRQAALLLDGPERLSVLARIDAVAARASSGLWHLEPSPVPTWPLWTANVTGDDALMLLGLVADDRAVSRWFPTQQTDLAAAGIDLLYLNGKVRSGLRSAEILAKSLKPQLRGAVGTRPGWLDHHLYPRPFVETITAEAGAVGLDPALLLGLIRQESRFDPLAVSAVSARGLTQFVVSTAEATAGDAGIDDLTPAMLHRPEIAIRLGATHLRKLADAFDDSIPAVLAAYNAGQPQAELWQAYCFGDDPAEFYAKVGFSQTKEYIAKVMANQARYRALYGDASISSADGSAR